jgi:hypothetical protein
MGNIQAGQLVMDEVKYLPHDHSEFPDLLLDAGDLLFNRTNSAELVGKSAVYRGHPSPCSYASYLIAVRFLQGCCPDLVAYFINSALGRQWVKSVASRPPTTGVRPSSRPPPGRPSRTCYARCAPTFGRSSGSTSGRPGDWRAGPVSGLRRTPCFNPL